MSEGIATHRPIMVVMRASHIPVASREASGAALSPMVWNTVTIPKMVPSRPSMGDITEISRR